MGALRRVLKVEFRPIGYDACLIPVKGGFEVHICRDHSEGRRNFSMAHEVGHILMMESTGQFKMTRREKKIGSYTVQEEEEYLCDEAASELVFPRPYFDDDVHRHGPTLRGVLDLAKEYRASLEATARRFVASGEWRCFFLFWKRGRTNPNRRLTVEAFIANGGPSISKNEIFLCDGGKALSAWESGRIVKGRQPMKFGEVEENYYMETLRIGSKTHPRFLSMVITEPLAGSWRRPRTQRDPQLNLFSHP
jgi:hypothetical protein